MSRIFSVPKPTVPLMELISEHVATTSSLGQILSEDIIYEILLRLPVKILLKMRCVSKSWFSLISSPQFVKDHLKLSATNKQFCLLYTNNSKTFHTCSLNAIIMYEEESPSSIPIKLDDFDRQDCTIVGSCDGLFCIMNKFRNIFVIWNPSTREFRQFPHLSSTGLSPQAYGFCYNERQNDHKVVVIAGSNDSDQYGGFSYEVNSYSLRTNSWQKILELTSATVGRFGYEIGALVNGRLHWIAAYPKPKAKVRSETFIFSLDLDDATYGKVALPKPEDKSEFEWYLDTLGGNLCVLYEYTLEDEFPRTDVWVMKEYGVVESWTRVISIPFCFIPIFMFQNDEILLHTDSNAMLYNSTHNSFKDPKNQINLDGGEIVVYIESLVSPNYN